MSMSITVTPASPVATQSACRVDVAGADVVDTSTYDVNAVPTMEAMSYYLTFELDSVIKGKSYLFNVNADGGHAFNSYIFPEAGSWTVRLNDARDDSSVGTQAVTVS